MYDTEKYHISLSMLIFPSFRISDFIYVDNSRVRYLVPFPLLYHWLLGLPFILTYILLLHLINYLKLKY